MTADAPRDVADEAATLIGDVGRSAERARRYRALAATIAEPTFDRVIMIGSEVRRAARTGGGGAIVTAVDELRALLRRCEEGIAEVQASTAYRSLAEAYAANDAEKATELAVAVFAGIVSETPSTPVHWPVPISSRRAGEHFVTPEQCATLIVEIGRAGITAPKEAPALGGDETIRPVRLTGPADASDGPITLAFDPSALKVPVGRLTEADDLLWYSAHLAAPFTVEATASVSDEWWEIRPSAYAQYLEDLRRALAERGLILRVS